MVISGRLISIPGINEEELSVAGGRFLKRVYTALPDFPKKMLFYGGRRYCPVCESSCRFFISAGKPARAEAMCPVCGAKERHRLLWRVLRECTGLMEGESGNVLHIAPELCFEKRLSRKVGSGYLTADLLDPAVMVKMDITDIQYDDHHFDVICCNDVLEHIPDDRTAMRELFRVLKPGGWAAIMVPVTAESTAEDPSITDPQERLRLFGQEDHVRRYGPDVVDRLREAGFDVRTVNANDVMGASDAARMNVGSRDVYLCTRPAGTWANEPSEGHP